MSLPVFRLAASRRSRSVTPEESRLWHHAMQDVTLLPEQSRLPPEPTPMPPAPPPPERSGPVFDPPPARPVRQRKPAALAPLEIGSGAGLDRRHEERLRRGQLPLERQIDLHGLIQEDAHAALSAFILRAWSEGRRCLLVITGKGRDRQPGERVGTLQQAVPRWLNESRLRPMILAVHHALPRDGGSGALYVLLRRRP